MGSRRLRLRTIITLGSIVPLLVLGMMAIIYFGASQYVVLQDVLEERTASATEILATASEYGLLSGDKRELEAVARQIGHLKYVAYVAIRNADNDLMAEEGRRRQASVQEHRLIRHVSISAPYDEADEVIIGSVEIIADASETVVQQRNMILIALMALVAIVAFSAFASQQIAVGIVTPVERLLDAVNDISLGKNVTINASAANELYILESGFNVMAQAITEHRNTLEEEVRVATLSLVEANQQLEAKNAQLEAAREQEVQSRVQVFASFQEGANALRSVLLHNIGNVVGGVTSRAESVANAAQSLYEIAGLLDSAQYHPDWGDEYARTVLVAVQKELLRLAQEEVEPHAAAIYKASLHIGEIIRVQRTIGRDTETAMPLSVWDLLYDAKTIAEALSVARGVRIEIIMDGSPIEARLSRNSLLQTVINLIKNALESVREKYHDNPEEGLVVVRASACSGQCFELSVHDNGAGFDVNSKDEIFRFGYTTKVTGSGLGLHAAANFVQISGGSITAESGGFGKGAVLRIKLPTNIAPQGELGLIGNSCDLE